MKLKRLTYRRNWDFVLYVNNTHYLNRHTLISPINEKSILFSCYVSPTPDVSLNKKADEPNDRNLIILVHQLVPKPLY